MTAEHSVAAPPIPADSPHIDQVLQLFSAALALETIGRDDNLFNLGGSSLHAARLINRVNKAFSTNMSLAAVFQAPTPSAFTQKLDAHLKNAASTEPPSQ